jgi:hypothetical protein
MNPRTDGVEGAGRLGATEEYKARKLLFFASFFTFSERGGERRLPTTSTAVASF